MTSDYANILSLLKTLHPVTTESKLIRLGNKHDGGYLLPADLNGIEACFSAGVGHTVEFEKDCLEEGMKIFLADNQMPENIITSGKMNYIQKFVGMKSTKHYIGMDDWVRRSDVQDESDLLLQMDIEGDEYFSILGLTEHLLQRFRIIIVEFHALQRLLNKDFFNLMNSTFAKLLKYHQCVHIHPNNCCGIYEHNNLFIPRVAEFTFYRKDRINKHKYRSDFPHLLDVDNTPNPSIILPDCWFRKQAPSS